MTKRILTPRPGATHADLLAGAITVGRVNAVAVPNTETNENTVQRFYHLVRMMQRRGIPVIQCGDLFWIADPTDPADAEAFHSYCAAELGRSRDIASRVMAMIDNFGEQEDEYDG